MAKTFCYRTSVSSIGRAIRFHGARSRLVERILGVRMDKRTMELMAGGWGDPTGYSTLSALLEMNA